VAATPAVRAAEEAGIAFTLHEYEHDPGSASYGDEVAAKLDVEPERLFKTLVVSVDGRLAVALVPVPTQLDLRALGKRAQLADKGQAQRTTGYVSGGTSPLGQRKRLPTHIDASALEHATILVNGGRRGLQMELDPRDLARLTDAKVHPIASAR
jgi:Cys-tRNA(Pro)/Cys-tRNA(Cys) deacylase